MSSRKTVVLILKQFKSALNNDSANQPTLGRNHLHFLDYPLSLVSTFYQPERSEANSSSPARIVNCQPSQGTSVDIRLSYYFSRKISNALTLSAKYTCHTTFQVDNEHFHIVHEMGHLYLISTKPNSSLHHCVVKRIQPRQSNSYITCTQKAIKASE